MSIRLSRTRVIAVVIAVIVIAIGGAAAVARLWPVQSHSQITVDYPREGALFPPDFAPPTLEWRDASQHAEVWTIDVGPGSGSAASLHVTSRGEPAQIGDIDQAAIGPSNQRRLTSLRHALFEFVDQTFWPKYLVVPLSIQPFDWSLSLRFGSGF